VTDVTAARRLGLALLQARLDHDDERFRLLLTTSEINAAALLTVYLDLLVMTVELGAIDRDSIGESLLAMAGSDDGR
jgi:fumarate reductase subunit D